MIGKAGDPVTSLSQAYPDRVEVRGRDLAGDLMGQVTFTEYFHLLLTGQEPTAEQRFFLDLVLVALAEHGLMPTNVAARMTLAAAPDALQGAVAAGILGAGTVVLGTSVACAELLEGMQEEVATGREPAAVASATAARSTQRAARCPGSAIRCTSRSTPGPRGSSSSQTSAASAARTSRSALALRQAVADTWGKPLTLNVSMAIAAVMLDLGFPSASVRAVPILARTASLLAHLAEEEENPLGFLLASKAEEAIEYRPPAE